MFTFTKRHHLKPDGTMDIFGFQGAQNSSPVQDSEALQEIQLERQNDLLLKRRNELQREIEELELRWNSLQSTEEVEIEEDQIILELLQSVALTDKESIVVENGFDDSQYSTKPLRQWDLRLEYLIKFYPYLTITSATSKLTLERFEDRPQVLKVLSFTINHGKVFIFEVTIWLRSTQNTYHIHALNITKQSRNKFNTLLTQIAEHYTKSKNINKFLYTVNLCYELVIKRQKLLHEIHDDHFSEPYKYSVQNNTLNIKNVTLIWDIIFDGEVKSLITVNPPYNDAFKEMVELYGVRKAMETLMDSIN